MTGDACTSCRSAVGTGGRCTNLACHYSSRLQPDRADRLARETAPGASTAPALLALDPSFTATGWAAFRLADDSVLAAGVIRTAPPKKADRKRATACEHDARRGLLIRNGVRDALRSHGCVLAVAETFGGSGSIKAGMTLARAHQAVADAVHSVLEGLPVYVTPHATRKAACGKLSASKDEVEAAVRERFPADWDALLEDVAPKKRENAFDAASAYLAAYEEPAVAAMRAMARRAVADG